MKRRLTLAILGTAAAALLLAGVGTLLLARIGARQAAENELRSQVESTADLVSLGQTRIGQLSTDDLDSLRVAVCPDATSPGSPTSTASGSVELERIKDSLCATSPEAALANTKRQLCDNPPARIDQSLTEEMRRARANFCANPNQTTLDELHGVYCRKSDDRTTGSAATTQSRRKLDQIRAAVCRLITVRTDTRQQLEETLSKESISLVVFNPDNSIREGEVPAGLNTNLLRPDLLRNGVTVSGAFGNGAFAVTAVDPDAANVSAIVIARPSDPVRGLMPYFLIACGITLMIGLVVAASLGRALTKPLLEARNATAEIADGNLAVRVPEHFRKPSRPKDELDELAQAINTMAATLERSRGLERQFLLSVSHDLRTPLTSIRGYAEAIADHTAPDPERAASIILAESRRLERLVQDLLDLAKLDARRFTFHIIEIDLNEVAGDSVDGFRREVDAAGLHIRLDAGPTPVPAYVDPDRLQQVIANLIENALKFAATTITVKVVPVATGGGGGLSNPRVEIIDDGPGIVAEDLPHVFERLYVASAIPRRKEVGSGLGLAIVREVAESMGGSVAAESNPTATPGARMVVTLSATPPPATTPPPAAST